MKNILFVSHSDFPANSAVHVHHFANELIELGYDCVVAVPKDKHSIKTVGGNLYKLTQFDEYDSVVQLFANQQPPDIVHAWTPRQHVRKYCYSLSLLHQFALVIHLEDNEESIIENFLQIPLEQWSLEAESKLSDYQSHPFKYKEFMNNADGVTVIMDKLKEFVPENTPSIVLYPGVDSRQFSPQAKNQDLLTAWEIPEDATVLSYTGNVHLTNFQEVRSLYLAVGNRNKTGKPTYLIRTGYDEFGGDYRLLEEDELWIKPYIIELGWVDRSRITEILALADILVQPGKADKFNDYRFPSKIPEFLGMGKPIIIPDTNIAKDLTHEENALIATSVDENTLPAMIDRLMEDQLLREKIANNGLQFALKRLNWRNSTEQLITFYQTLLTQEQQLQSRSKALARCMTYHQELKEQLTQENEDLAQRNEILTQINEGLKEENEQLLQEKQELTINDRNQQKKLQELAELKNNNQQLQAQLDGVKAESQLEIQQLTQEIEAMKTSKFWKLRKLWFKVKQPLNQEK